MKIITHTLAAAIMLVAAIASAQDIDTQSKIDTLALTAPVLAPDSLLVAPDGFRIVDSIIYTPVGRYNEALADSSLYEALPAGVQLHQSANVTQAAMRQIEDNASTLTDGYRIRIFFDNKQDARNASLESEERFRRLFPGYNTYRTFQNPFFKVTVGDFRTKVDAQKALHDIVRTFPSAFIVKEKMRFPVISETVRVRVDTVRLLMPVPQEAVATPETETAQKTGE